MVLHKIHYHTHGSNSQKMTPPVSPLKRELLVHFCYKKLCGLGICLPGVMEKNATPSLNSDCALSSHLSQRRQHDTEATNWFLRPRAHIFDVSLQFTQTSSHRNTCCQLFFQESFCSVSLHQTVLEGDTALGCPRKLSPAFCWKQRHYAFAKASRLRYQAADLVP